MSEKDSNFTVDLLVAVYLKTCIVQILIGSITETKYACEYAYVQQKKIRNPKKEELSFLDTKI